jgi:quinol monooxygenase YgiN
MSFGPWRDARAAEAWRKTPEFRNAFTRFKELCSDIQPNTLECVVSVGD